ncbi:ABC transporter permease [Salinisphaera hydrothermalis]|uniref:ABC transporter permease n=1 Tax=Salinisphaera hydrothermalis TaxID=563188 RepID=UPI00333F0415
MKFANSADKRMVDDAPTPTTTPGTHQARPLGGTALYWLGRNSIWVILLVCVVGFSFGSPYFFTVFNLSNILVQSAFIGFLSIGMTLIMINGNIDLTVGSTLGLCACLAIGLQQYGVAVAVTGALGAGLLLGFVNGIIVVKTGVHSFIVTLGGLIGIRGLVFVYTGENSLSATNMSFMDFGMISIGPVSLIAVLFLGFMLFAQWALSRTRHGREAYAIGGNRQAAENAGIKVSRHIVINFMVSGLMAAVAGITMSAQMGAATPNLGTNYELWTIIAVVLGGTKLQGGAGALWGTLGGVLTLGVLRNGMNLMHVQPFYVLVLLGVVLIFALIVDKQFNRE